MSYFSIFKRFSIYKDVAPLGVMIRLRAADESSLSDDAIKLIIKTVIRLAHLHKSIFYLFFIKNLKIMNVWVCVLLQVI